MRTSIIWRNAKHSAKDYLLYQLTMLLSLSLVYAFNLLVFSEEIKQLSGQLNALTMVVVGISFVVVWVIGWLVYYMSRFMLEKRSREFGTYLLLGVSNKTVASVFVKENMLMGAIAFAASLVTGTFLYRLLSLIIVHMFHSTYQIKMLFSWPALLLTLGYTILVYGNAMVRMRRYLKRVEIQELLYTEKRSEATSRETGRKGLRRFFIYLGTLAFLLTLTLTASQMGGLFERFFNEQTREVLGFDIAVSSREENPDFGELIGYVEGRYGVSFQKQYPLYLLEERGLYEYCGRYGYIEGTPVLAWSDFRELWKALGYEELELEEGRYLLLGAEKIKEKTKKAAAPALRVKGAKEVRMQA